MYAFGAGICHTDEELDELEVRDEEIEADEEGSDEGVEIPSLAASRPGCTCNPH